MFSKFQVFDWTPDPNFPLTDSDGIVQLFDADGELASLYIPSDMQTGNYWIIGTFNGVGGLKEIDISNTVVSDLNLVDLCGSTKLFQIAGIDSRPPKRPAVRIDGIL